MRAAREREHFTNTEGREPTVGEMADLLGVEREQAAEAMGAALPPSPHPLGRGGRGDQIDVPVSPPDELLTDRLALRQVLGNSRRGTGS